MKAWDSMPNHAVPNHPLKAILTYGAMKIYKL